MTTRSRASSPSALDRLDAALFVVAGLSTLWLAYLLARESVRSGWELLLLVVFWFLVAHLLLPRLHRILTRVYVPGYFIGRTRTSDGLLGDPVDLALLGQEAQVHLAMHRAGWTRAHDLGLASGSRVVASTLRRQSYPEAPVSPLLLFDRQQDFAYQQEVAGSTSTRHHVRFWRAPEGWRLPGGWAVGWLAAGTYDRSIGLSLFTLQVTHRIDADTGARVVLMLSSVVAVVAAFVDDARHPDLITLGTLPTVGLSILILLALSSHRARDHAVHGRRAEVPQVVATA